MMKLSQQRILFSKMVRQLLSYIEGSSQYEYAIDFVKRCADCPVGATFSKHKEGLAIDIHLYDAEGRYLSNGAEHARLGVFWKSLGGSWGGDFGDPNHYSLGE